MSGSDHAILDLGEDDLQFTTTDYKAQGSGSASLTQFPNPSPDKDTDMLITEGEGQGGPGEWKTSNFWTLAFYQQFFDVDTTDVKKRLMYSMVPVPGKSFLQHHIRPRPDLYGPFWICCTLVFSIAISGNLSDFLQKSVDPDLSVKWHYDFHKVTLAATAVFSYAGLVPASLYGFLWWSSSGVGTATLSFLELVCLYGYSLAIYIPVSLLWLVQVSWWQWLCVLAGAGMSGYVLFLPIWPAVRDQAAKSAVLVMVVVLALHLLLACGFMLYFFHVPATAATAHNSTEVITPAPPVIVQDNDTKEEEPEKAPLVHNAAEPKTEEKRSNKPDSASDVNDIGGAEVDENKDTLKGKTVAEVSENKDTLKDKTVAEANENKYTLKDDTVDSNGGTDESKKA
jgi:hypothetical protein